jgi:hypothetical protein
MAGTPPQPKGRAREKGKNERRLINSSYEREMRYWRRRQDLQDKM